MPLDVWKWRLVMRNWKETYPKKFPFPLQTGRPQRSIKIPGKLIRDMISGIKMTLL
jgi:hypothetical protein